MTFLFTNNMAWVSSMRRHCAWVFLLKPVHLIGIWLRLSRKKQLKKLPNFAKTVKVI